MMIIRFTSLLFLSAWTLLSFGQNSGKNHGIGIYQSFTDYNVKLLSGSVFTFDSALSLSTRLAYQRKFSPRWTLNAGISNGFIQNQAFNDRHFSKLYALGADASILYTLNNGNLIKEDARIGPFLVFGYRMDYIPKLKEFGINQTLAYNQYGIGFNIRVGARTHLQIQTNIDQKLSDNFNTHMMYRMGLTQVIGIFDNQQEKRIKEPIILDQDGDGIVDSKDNCPLLPGSFKNNGCPDSAKVDQHIVNSDSLEIAITLLEAKVDSLIIVSKNSQSLNKELEARISGLKDSITIFRNSGTGKVITVTDTVFVAKSAPKDSMRTVVATAPKVDKTKTSKVSTVGGSYYVIVKSVRNELVANQYKTKVEADFDNVILLKQDNGFYRVAIIAGNSYNEAKTLMDQVHDKGYEPVWLSKE